MAEVTVMVLKVDLKCSKCYKKVKKVLCKFPEIRDQVFDEKQNAVTIKVVSCCPERIKQKICCKGGKPIQSIEIKPPEKSKPTAAEKKEETKKPDEKKPNEAEKKEPEKAKDKPKVIPVDPKDKPKVKFVDPPAKQKPQPTAQQQTKPPEPAPPTKVLVPVPGYPPCYPNYPIGICCRECSEGRRGGACEQLSYGGPPCYGGGYYGRPVYDSWGVGGGYYNKGYYRDRGDYFCEENPSTCSIM